MNRLIRLYLVFLLLCVMLSLVNIAKAKSFHNPMLEIHSLMRCYKVPNNPSTMQCVGEYIMCKVTPEFMECTALVPKEVAAKLFMKTFRRI